VTAVNDAPVADSQTDGNAVSAIEDTAINIVLTGSDVEGDALAFLPIDDDEDGIPDGLDGELSANPELDNDTNVTVTYTPTLNFNGPTSFTFVVEDEDSEPLTSNVATVEINVAADNFVSHWKGEGDASDEEETNAGTFAAGTFASGVDPQAFDLTGTGDFVIVNPVSAFATDAITTTFWMRSIDSEGALVSYATGMGDSAREWLIRVCDLGTVTGCPTLGSIAVSRETQIDSEIVFADTTGNPVNDGAWHHIAVTWNNGDGVIEIYVDGAIQTTVDENGMQPAPTRSVGSLGGSGSLVFGQEQSNVGGGFIGTSEYNGLLDEVEIHNVVLGGGAISTAFDALKPRTTTFTATSGDWDDDTKWDNGVPRSTVDKAVISSTATDAQLNVDYVNIGTSTLTIEGTLTVQDGVTLDNGDEDFGQPGKIDITSSGTLNVAGTLNSNVAGSTIENAGTMSNSGTSITIGAGTTFTNTGTITNTGAIAVAGILTNGNSIDADGADTIDNNSPDGSISVSSGGTFTNTEFSVLTNTGGITNDGTFNVEESFTKQYPTLLLLP